MSEKTLHRAVCDYLRYHYPYVIFNTDLSGSMRLTMGQAVAIKAPRSNRGFPDLVIYEPRGIYHGLFIELKKEGERLYTKEYTSGRVNKDSRPVSPHIAEQIQCLVALRERGYKAEFAVGFNQAKELIDNYLNQ